MPSLVKRMNRYKTHGRNIRKTWIPTGIITAEMEGHKSLVAAQGKVTFKNANVNVFLERKWVIRSECPPGCGKPVFRISTWGDENWNIKGQVRYATVVVEPKAGGRAKVVKWELGAWEDAGNDHNLYRQSSTRTSALGLPSECTGCKKLEEGDSDWVAVDSFAKAIPLTIPQDKD